jgi:hypothetical protein
MEALNESPFPFLMMGVSMIHLRASPFCYGFQHCGYQILRITLVFIMEVIQKPLCIIYCAFEPINFFP